MCDTFFLICYSSSSFTLVIIVSYILIYCVLAKSFWNDIILSCIFLLSFILLIILCTYYHTIFYAVDMKLINTLVEAIQDFEGGLVIVSHDQHFITNTCGEL